MSASLIRPWLVCPLPQPDAQATLVCFPHSGAGIAGLVPWSRSLDPRIEVYIAQLPAREQRLREPPEPRLDVLASAMADTIPQLPARRTGFFGHSFGALLAFETIRTLRARGERLPAHLVVSSQRGPQCPDRLPPICHLPDRALAATVSERYGGIPESLLDQPELLAFFLPALRADLTAQERYRYHAAPPLELPITAWGGTEDAAVPASLLEDWRHETTGAFTSHLFDGGHFYLKEHQDAILSRLTVLTLAGAEGSPAGGRG